MGRLLVPLVVVAAGCATSPSRDASLARHADPPQANQIPVQADAPSQIHATQLVAHQEASTRPSNVLFDGPMSVDELIAYAVANNPAIGAARSRAEALISRVPQARSLDDPMLTSTTFLEEIQTAAGPQDAMLSLSQKFPWFGKRNARGEIAFHDAQVAYAELANVELGVVEAVKLAYYDLYFLDRAIRIYKDLEPELKRVIAITRTRYETNAKQVGLESVLQAQVTLHKLQITLAELEQAKLKAAARLSEALHLPRGFHLNIQPQLEKETLPRDVESLVAMIEYCHPRLEAHRRAVTRDQWSVDLARRDYYPDVSLGFNWNAIGERGLSAVANGRDAYSLMVGINVPVYRAKRAAAVREARFRTTQSAQQYDATWDTLRADVERFHADAIEQDRVLRILNRDILRKAQQTFDLSIEAFRVNRIGFQQLIDNYEALLRFRLNRHLRRSRREQAIAQLERAVGCAVADSQPRPEEVPGEYPSGAGPFPPTGLRRLP